MATRERKHRAGHYEILGETLAQFEFFEAGWNPYQRYLDVDKVDFILRKREGDDVIYREVQVKYGKLYDCTLKWEQPLFDLSSWRFFKDQEFSASVNRKDFFLAYILAHDSGYKGDIFVFPVAVFDDLLSKAIVSAGQRMVWISRSKADPARWYFRIKRGFDQIGAATCIDVSSYHRNFALLER
jgi:hypothetical protein